MKLKKINGILSLHKRSHEKIKMGKYCFFGEFIAVTNNTNSDITKDY